jgi:hypothetical protein
MVRIEMNSGWEDELGRMAFEAVQSRLQPVLDRVHEQYAGRPVNEIKPVLAREWAANTEGGSIADPELTQYATVISEGHRIVLQRGETSS